MSARPHIGPGGRSWPCRPSLHRDRYVTRSTCRPARFPLSIDPRINFDRIPPQSRTHTNRRWSFTAQPPCSDTPDADPETGGEFDDRQQLATIGRLRRCNRLSSTASCVGIFPHGHAPFTTLTRNRLAAIPCARTIPTSFDSTTTTVTGSSRKPRRRNPSPAVSRKPLAGPHSWHGSACRLATGQPETPNLVPGHWLPAPLAAGTTQRSGRPSLGGRLRADIETARVNAKLRRYQIGLD